MAADAGKLQKQLRSALDSSCRVPKCPKIGFRAGKQLPCGLRPLWSHFGKYEKLRNTHSNSGFSHTTFSHNLRIFSQKVRLFSPTLRYVSSPLGKMNFPAVSLNFSAMFLNFSTMFWISPVSQFGSSFVRNFKVNPRRYGLERPTSTVQALPSALNPAFTHSIPIISLRTKYLARSPSAETSQILRGCLQARSLSCVPVPPHSCPSELWGLSPR